MATIYTVNNGTELNTALGLAVTGDTVHLNAGTYSFGNGSQALNLTTAGITIEGAGPGTIIQGNFFGENGIAPGTNIDTWIQTAPSYLVNSGAGIRVSADDIVIKDLTIQEFTHGIFIGNAAIPGQAVDNLTIQNVTVTQTIIGIYSDTPAQTTITDFEMTGGAITHSYEGLLKEHSAAGAGLFDGIVVDGTAFSDLTAKGIYLEQASNALFDNITMDNVGQFGRVPTFGGIGQFGSGFELNVKFGAYSNITLEDFDFTNVGWSNGAGTPHFGGAAIAVKPRDDNATPVTLDDVTIQNGVIDGTTSTGIRFGEPNKLNVGPTNSSVLNVDITGATVAEYDNRTTVQMDVTLTPGDDEASVNPLSTGSFHFDGDAGNDVITSGGVGGGVGDTIDGGAGNDTLDGAAGIDTLNGEADNDVLIGGAGADVLNGGTGNDAASYATAGAGVEVNLDTGVKTGDATGDSYSSIEIIVGSGFNDTLTGDDGTGNADSFFGGAGIDTLVGNDGNDRLWGDAGADTIDGGAGEDHAIYDNSALGVTVDLNLAVQSDPGTDADGDVLISIESVHGSLVGSNTLTGTDAGNEHLKGGNVADVLTGMDGIDTLDGLAGNDVLDAGAGNDIVNAGDDADTVSGGTGNDTLNGDGGDDTLAGGLGVDTLNGGAGIDTADFTGEAGVTVNLNTMIASNGDVLISIENLVGVASASGGTGDDTVSGGGGNDQFTGNGGDDDLSGGAGNDKLLGGTGGDTLDGGGDNDRLDGNQGDDVLNGGTGNDTLLGGAGNDTLNGGEGDDRLIGGSGADTFIIDPLSGDDVIAGFDKLDVVDVSALGIFTDVTDVQAAATNVRGGVLIDLGGGNSLTILGKSVATLDNGDFIF